MKYHERASRRSVQYLNVSSRRLILSSSGKWEINLDYGTIPSDFQKWVTEDVPQDLRASGLSGIKPADHSPALQPHSSRVFPCCISFTTREIFSVHDPFDSALFSPEEAHQSFGAFQGSPTSSPLLFKHQPMSTVEQSPLPPSISADQLSNWRTRRN